MKNDFSQPERQALMDLLVVGMYADGHLATSEDDRIKKYLGTIGFNSDYDQGQFVDASITRASRHAQNEEERRGYIRSLVPVFKSDGTRREAFGILGSLLASDGKFSESESQFLATVRELFGIQ